MEKRRAQLPQLKQAKDKLAYFSLDKLIISDRRNGPTNGLREHIDLFTLSDNKWTAYHVIKHLIVAYAKS